MLHRILGEHIELRWDFPKTLPGVLADVANVEQVIVNLALNARDACPPAGGAIRIAASYVARFSPPPGNNVTESRSGYIAIRVTDNGGGIPAEVLPRIFEPFFTTKEVGKGTGLGLSTAYSIVRQHGGWIDVQSAPGQGSTFTVYQPVATADTAILPSTAKMPDLDTPILPRQRVLLVEDDPAVQSVLEVLFARQGFESVSAPDGAAALRIWEEQKANFGLLVTDMVMPNGCNGLELARTLRERTPDLKVIVMTGYSADLLQPEQFALPGPPPRLLFKPFDLRDVLTAIAKA
jgi:CheY-like chemotaxis protein